MFSDDLTRSRLLALAADRAAVVAIVTVIAIAAIVAALALRRWCRERRQAREQRAIEREKMRRMEAGNPIYDVIAWREFCERNNLTERFRSPSLSRNQPNTRE